MYFIIESPAIKVFLLLLCLFYFCARFFSPVWFFCKLSFPEMSLLTDLYTVWCSTLLLPLLVFFEIVSLCSLDFGVTSFCVCVSSWLFSVLMILVQKNLHLGALFPQFWNYHYLYRLYGILLGLKRLVCCGFPEKTVLLQFVKLY